MPGDTPIEELVFSEIPFRHYNGGIWDSVELMEVPALQFEETNNVFVRPNPANGIVDVRAWVRNSAATTVSGSLTITVNPGGFQALFTDLSFPPGVTQLDRQVQITNHHLWDINDPYLYTLSTQVRQNGSTSYDEKMTRCGFRTFNFENGFFKLNGSKIYLHGVVATNWNMVGSRPPYDPNLLRQDIINLKQMGFNAIRFGAGLPPRRQLDACDELGILAYEETLAGWGTCLSYSTQMGARFDTGIRGMIKRDRNHPSVVKWGLLNERPNNEIFQYAVNSLALVRSLDDHTRVVVLNSGRFDETGYGSIANPNSDSWETNTAYYPSDQHCYYPVPHTLSIINTLRTMHGVTGQGVLLSENGIGSALHLPHMLDIYTQLGALNQGYGSSYQSAFGLFMSDWDKWNMADTFATPAAYFDQCLAKVARLRLIAVNAIRSNPNITGYYLTGNVDEAYTGLGITNEFSEIKPGHEAVMLDLWSPLRFCNFVQPVNVYKDATIHLEAVLVNENTLAAGTYSIHAKVYNDQNSVVWSTNSSLTISSSSPWVVSAFSQNVSANWPEGKYRFVMTGDFGSKTATGGIAEFYVLDPATESPVTSTVTLWAADSVLSNWLTQKGIPYQSFDKNAPLGSQSVILAGMNRPSFTQSAFDDLMERVEAGSVVIFLCPQIFASGSDTSYYVPLTNKGSLNDLTGGWVFPKDDWAKNHPIFQNMPSGNVLDYTYYREIIPSSVWVGQDTPYEAVCGGINTAGSFAYQSGMSLAVHRKGAGAFIINALLIRDNLGSVPAADRLLRNMIRYAATAGFVPKNCTEVWTYGYGLAEDLNYDCRVNLADFAPLASEWLQDNRPVVSNLVVGNPSASNGWSTTSAVTATSSGYQYTLTPTCAINGSGLDAATGTMHNNQIWNVYWDGPPGGGTTTPRPGTVTPCLNWIAFQFDKIYSLTTMHVWNYNYSSVFNCGSGAKDVTVQYSLTGGSDPAEWITLGTFQVAKGTALNDFVGNDVCNFAGALVKYVCISIISDWGSPYGDQGIAEVRFSGSPAQVQLIGNPNAGNGWSTTSAVTATSSGYQYTLTPECAINGSGLDAATGTMHSNDIWNLYWDAPAGGGTTTPHLGTVVCTNWIAFEFDKVYSLATMHVWNYNYGNVYNCGSGAKDVTIQYSLTGGSDSSEWTTLGTFQVAKGTALNDFIGNDVCNFNGALAKYVCLSIISDWGSPYGDQGIAEVRFSGSPAQLPCGSLGFEYIPGDIDKNCVVDMNDLAALVAEWLSCNNPVDANCTVNW
jgi:hypothetical protein